MLAEESSSTTNPIKVALAGCSGIPGRNILRSLLTFRRDGPNFDITILVRSTSSVKTDEKYVSRVDYNRLKKKEVDYNRPETISRALVGIDVVISALHAEPGPLYDNILLNTIIEGSERRIVDSSRPLLFITGYTLDILHTSIDPTVAEKVLGPKVRFARRLRAEAEKHRGFTYCTLVTAGFLDYILPKGYAGFDLVAGKATLWDEGSKEVTGCTLDFVGSCVVEVCRMFCSNDPGEYRRIANQRLKVAETKYTGLDILKLSEALTARKFEVEHATTTGSQEKAQALCQEGEEGRATGVLFKRLVWGGEGSANLEEGLGFAADRLARKSLREVVAQAITEANSGLPSFREIGR